MPSPDAPFPKPSAAARRALDAALALAGSDPAAARGLATPLLGQPGLHAEALVLLIDLCRRQGDVRTATLLAQRAARLAPKSGRARTLAAMALREAGQPERALGQALAAVALTPDDAAAQVAVVLAALAVSRPLAGLAAAVALCRASSHPEALAAAAGLLDACAGGQPWGAVWVEDAAIAGCVRYAGAGPVVVVFSEDSAVLGRAAADIALPGPAPLAGFRFETPPGLPAGTIVEATLADAGTPLFGSPVHLPEVRPSGTPAACPEAPLPAAALPAPPEALARLNAWLRQAALTPQAPPPLPEACLGAAVGEARACIAARAAALEAGLAERGPKDDDHD